jgi:nucleotide sugar dehydrogenase
MRQLIFDIDLPKIGIIGVGFVGEAIRANYESFNLSLLDSDPNKNYNSSYNDLKQCEGIFVCVPSPMKLDGSCDSSILENVLLNLKDYKGVIISKVTATPDIYERLQSQYENLVYIPEFLTAANAIRDYENEKWAIIGGSVRAYQNEASRIIQYAKKDAQIVLCSIGEASLVKYTINSFLATKVVFMNELEQLATSQGYDWNSIRKLLLNDKRIGDSHTQVPGPDGYYGFGGMCFPKDTSALLSYAEQSGVHLNILKESVKKNTLLRLQKPK